MAICAGGDAHKADRSAPCARGSAGTAGGLAIVPGRGAVIADGLAAPSSRGALEAGSKAALPGGRAAYAGSLAVLSGRGALIVGGLTTISGRGAISAHGLAGLAVSSTAITEGDSSIAARERVCADRGGGGTRVRIVADHQAATGGGDRSVELAHIDSIVDRGARGEIGDLPLGGRCPDGHAVVAVGRRTLAQRNAADVAGDGALAKRGALK